MLENIERNRRRLGGADYALGALFQSKEYGWPGDWEGRALLAFTCHYEMDGFVFPAMHPFVAALKEKTNGGSYFGKPFDGAVADEQQLAGHNWYLRGLLRYAEDFGSDAAMRAAERTVENLYLPAAEWYRRYPAERAASSGGVSGSAAAVQEGWKLSTDVGCAFLCADGLAHYYAATQDARVRRLLDAMFGIFVRLCPERSGFQTHATLSCARGMLKMYEATGGKEYLSMAESVMQAYVSCGMTLTYENFNWFGRQDSWTEPCAVVDSLLLALGLYRCTQAERYRTLARRIWFNGLQFCQRQNGGAGPNSCVTQAAPVLRIYLYEAPFCCTMRYAEGLLAYVKNAALFAWDAAAAAVTEEDGRRYVDDKLLVRQDGEVRPLFPCHSVSEKEAKRLCLQVLW